MNKKYPLIKDFPQKYSKDEIIPEEINIKLILKNYINKLPLLEKFASENIKIIKPKDKNLYEAIPSTPNIMKTGNEKIDKQKIYNMMLVY